MPEIDLFLDSSALIAGILTEQGAARALLLLGEDGKIVLSVSEQVIVEVERNIARKVARALPLMRELILRTDLRILPDPPFADVQQCRDWIQHKADVPILAAAARANVDCLVTLNSRHFLDDPGVALRSGLRIGTPGDALAWVRQQWVD